MCVCVCACVCVCNLPLCKRQPAVLTGAPMVWQCRPPLPADTYLTVQCSWWRWDTSFSLEGRPRRELASVLVKYWQRAWNWSHQERGCFSLSTLPIISSRCFLLEDESGKKTATPFTTISSARRWATDTSSLFLSRRAQRWLRMAEEVVSLLSVPSRDDRSGLMNGRADFSSHRTSRAG